MKKQYTAFGYKITTDPHFLNQRYGITPELEKQFSSLYYETQDKNNKKIIDKLIELILKFPRVPILKNYLSAAYNVQGKHAKSIEVNQSILSEHPDYIYGLLNQANKYIDNKEYNKVPEILGENLEIKALYPNRDLFHLTEITSFYKLTIRYYVAIENQELAENRFELLQEISPLHPDTEEAESYLMELRFKNANKRLEAEHKLRITPIQEKLIPKSRKSLAPKFNHLEIYNLYNLGINIPQHNLKEIIALPHASLVEDLERMLQDAVNRYSYFTKLEWEEETHHFVLHALFLLKEINAVESLPKILSFLKYDKDFLEFYIGDHITDSLWQCFYSLGFNNTTTLKAFLLLPGIDTYSKIAISDTFCQIVLHHPDKRNEILTIYSEVLTKFSIAQPKDNLIDSDFLGLIIGDALDCNFHELLPIIKILYEKRYVSLSVCGDFNEVEKAFANPAKIDHKRLIYNIFELYDNVLNTWAGYQEEEESTYFHIPQQAVSDKIGRNEPCPCGSGKKYKKCCLEN